MSGGAVMVQKLSKVTRGRRSGMTASTQLMSLVNVLLSDCGISHFKSLQVACSQFI